MQMHLLCGRLGQCRRRRLNTIVSIEMGYSVSVQSYNAADAHTGCISITPSALVGGLTKEHKSSNFVETFWCIFEVTRSKVNVMRRFIKLRRETAFTHQRVTK